MSLIGEALIDLITIYNKLTVRGKYTLYLKSDVVGEISCSLIWKPELENSADNKLVSMKTSSFQNIEIKLDPSMKASTDASQPN